MAETKYSLLSTEPPRYESDSESDREDSPLAPNHVLPEGMQARINAHFNQPTPSLFSRAALIIFFLFICWLAFRMRMGSGAQQVVYADRYSAEFKYRPAASPIITENLKNGNIRVRGAAPMAKVIPKEHIPLGTR